MYVYTKTYLDTEKFGQIRDTFFLLMLWNACVESRSIVTVHIKIVSLYARVMSAIGNGSLLTLLLFAECQISRYSVKTYFTVYQHRSTRKEVIHVKVMKYTRQRNNTHTKLYLTSAKIDMVKTPGTSAAMANLYELRPAYWLCPKARRQALDRNQYSHTTRCMSASRLTYES
jgi:hypothetical protein